MVFFLPTLLHNLFSPPPPHTSPTTFLPHYVCVCVRVCVSPSPVLSRKRKSSESHSTGRQQAAGSVSSF